MLTAVIRLVLVVFALAATAGKPATAQQSFAASTVTVETAGAAKLRFKVEVAETQTQQAQGLMFRRQMPPDAGMLFIYSKPQVAAFWMKNTFIPLDMLFIAADGRIVHIHPNATPQSEATITTPQIVKAVMEINGGLAARLGVRVGDIVRHAAFNNAATP